MRACTAAAFIAWVTAGIAATGTAWAATPCTTELEAGPTRTVARIVDGETVVLDDGSELRLLGALAPRALDVGSPPGAWPPETQTQDALRALMLGKSMEIRFDGAREDRYGRRLGHAILSDGTQRRWVQGYLLEQGLARAYASFGSRACAAELLAAERAGREAGRGLWAHAAYQIRRAADTKDLIAYRNTFQLVEGTVVSVAFVRGTIYLNFERKWRGAFSASLRRDDRGLLGAFSTKPKELEGRRVRVRGWIEQRGGGPAIDLSAAGPLEVLDQASK
jgi:endonuclease YncB( thermonuclease family)